MAVAVVVKEHVKEGQLDAYVSHMGEAIALTKQEEGNIAYDLYEAADGSDEVVMVEIWETQEALDRHMRSEHFLRIIPAGDAYKTAPSEIKVYNRL
jgi:quinol monooxygenase YgiN